VTPQTIYTWVEQDEDREHWQGFFRRGGRPPKPLQTGQIPRQVRIDGRPEAANRRKRLGDFEGDTIVTAVNAAAWSLWLIGGVAISGQPTQGPHAGRTRRKMERLLKNLAPELRQTITFDNGKEFSEHEALARHLGIDVYFAHPYASWERGTSENTNRLLRQYYPKGTDFAEVSHYDLASTVESIINVHGNVSITKPPARSSSATPAPRVAIEIGSCQSCLWPFWPFGKERRSSQQNAAS